MEGEEAAFPSDDPDERELLLSWLDYLRGAVVRNARGVDEAGARWRPEGRPYRQRAVATNRVVRSLTLDAPGHRGKGGTLRWVLLHLINETARHAGHADAVRELLDGTTGE